MNNEPKLNARTVQRKGYAVSHTLFSNCMCVFFALLTTLFIWLSGAI